MSNQTDSVEMVRVTKQARPWSGFFLGLTLGVAIAVVLQQGGVWPLDRLLLFGSAGLFALLGILLATVGRQAAGVFSSVLPILLAAALVGFAATGLGAVDDTGEINGGCAVRAASAIDTTEVTDTSARDPFLIDPERGLSWIATSPAPIMNHFWEVYVDVGGFAVVIASNDEAEPNTDGSTENVGEVEDLSAFIATVSDYSGLELDGVFEVGGDIEGEGGACDGFGFVELSAAPFSTLVSQIAAGVGLIALIWLLVLAFNRTRMAEVIPDEPETPVEDGETPASDGEEEDQRPM